MAHGHRFAAALIASLPALRRYAAGLAGNAEAGDDLVQDCIERALRRSATLADEARPLPWLRAILHNLFIDEMRRRRRAGEQLDLAAIADSAQASQPARQGEAAEMMRALAQLSLEHRQILLLVGVEGLRYEEVAAELQIPIGTVMSRLSRARERLRAALDGSPETITVLPGQKRRSGL